MYKINVNNRIYDVEARAKETLLHILRERLDLTGTKCGCGEGVCGTCKVIVDGNAVQSCMLTAEQLDGKKIMTVEGLADGERLHPIQIAFIEAGAVQCGFCTPGMIMTTKALLDKNPRPDEQEIRKALAGNLCRCTGYVKIVEAVKSAAKLYRGESQ